MPNPMVKTAATTYGKPAIHLRVNQGWMTRGVTRPWPREGLQNPESQRTESNPFARAFADVREQWPPVSHR